MIGDWGGSYGMTAESLDWFGFYCVYLKAGGRSYLPTSSGADFNL